MMIPSIEHEHPPIQSSTTSPYSQPIHEIHNIEKIVINYPTLLIDTPSMAQGCVFESNGNQVHLIMTDDKYFVSLWNSCDYTEKYCPINFQIFIKELLYTKFVDPLCIIKILAVCKEPYNVENIDFDTATLSTLLFDDVVPINNMSRSQNKRHQQLEKDVIDDNHDQIVDILFNVAYDTASPNNSHDKLLSVLQHFSIKGNDAKWHKFMYQLTCLHPAIYESKMSALIKHSFLGQLDDELFLHVTKYLKIDENTINELQLNIMKLIQYMMYHSHIHRTSGFTFKQIIFNTNEHYMLAFEDFYEILSRNTNFVRPMKGDMKILFLFTDNDNSDTTTDNLSESFSVHKPMKRKPKGRK